MPSEAINHLLIEDCIKPAMSLSNWEHKLISYFVCFHLGIERRTHAKAKAITTTQQGFHITKIYQSQ